MRNLKQMIALEMSAKAAFEAAHDTLQKVAAMADEGDEWAVQHLFEYSVPAMQKASANLARIQAKNRSENLVIAS